MIICNADRKPCHAGYEFSSQDRTERWAAYDIVSVIRTVPDVVIAVICMSVPVMSVCGCRDHLYPMSVAMVVTAPEMCRLVIVYEGLFSRMLSRTIKMILMMYLRRSVVLRPYHGSYSRLDAGRRSCRCSV